MKVHGSRLKILLFNTNTRGPKGEKDDGRKRGRSDGRDGMRGAEEGQDSRLATKMRTNNNT